MSLRMKLEVYDTNYKNNGEYCLGVMEWLVEELNDKTVYRQQVNKIVDGKRLYSIDVKPNLKRNKDTNNLEFQPAADYTRKTLVKPIIPD